MAFFKVSTLRVYLIVCLLLGFYPQFSTRLAAVVKNFERHIGSRSAWVSKYIPRFDVTKYMGVHVLTLLDHV